MKKRIFYVVNLDRNRILILAIIAAGFLGISFATGYRLANNSFRSPVALQADLNEPAGPLKAPENGEITLRSEEAPSRGDREPDQGSSIYETDRDTPPGGARDRAGDAAVRRSLDATDGSPERPSDDSTDRTPSRDERSHSSSAPSAPRERKKRKSDDSHSTSSEKKRTDRSNRKQSKEKKSKKEKEKDRKRDRKTNAEPEPGKTKEATRKETEKEQASKSAGTSVSRSTAKEGKREGEKQDPRAAVLDYRESAVRMANVAPSATRKHDAQAHPPGDPSSTNESPGYTLQLGAFTTRGPADRMAETLKKRGISAAVVHSSSHYLVRVGSAADRSGLAPLEAKLKKEHYSYLIVKK